MLQNFAWGCSMDTLAPKCEKLSVVSAKKKMKTGWAWMPVYSIISGFHIGNRVEQSGPIMGKKPSQESNIIILDHYVSLG